jgi:hypothetical protein
VSVGWTDATPAAVRIALQCCRGVYQRNIVLGSESLSGSTLKGKAAKYGAHYRQSRDNLLSRLHSADLDVSERRGVRGRRILVLRTLCGHDECQGNSDEFPNAVPGMAECCEGM